MRSILTVFSWDVFCKVLVGLAGILLIRTMWPDEYAAYTLAIAGAAVVAQTVSATFNRIYVVGYRQFQLQGALSSFLLVQLLLVGALVVLTAPWAGLANGLYWCAVALVLGTCAADMSRTAAQQQLRFGRFALIEVVRSSVFFAGVMLLALFQHGMVLAWQAVLLQAAGSAIVFVLFLARHLDLRQLVTVSDAVRLSGRIVQGHYRYLFAYFSILTVFGQADVFMLRMLSDSHSLATYGSAFRYYSLLLLVLGAVHAVLMPQVQRLDTVREVRALYARQQWLLVGFVPFVAACAWAAGWFIPMVDQGKYPEAVAVFRVLSVSAAISFAFSPYVNILLRFETFRFLFWGVVGALAVSLGSNAILVPRFGAVGASFTTLVATASLTVPIFVLASRLLREGTLETRAGGAGENTPGAAAPLT